MCKILLIDFLSGLWYIKLIKMSSTLFTKGRALKSIQYNQRHEMLEVSVMPKKVQLKAGEESFGSRLARLRKAGGYTLRDLASEIGVSHRMLIHYEKHSGYPTSNLLPLFSKALGVSADQLLGIEKVKETGRMRDTKLWRRFVQVEKLPQDRRRSIVQFVDTFLENEALKKAK